MRIATTTIFDQGLWGMMSRQEAMFKAQEQANTGLRVNRPSDDPVAASLAENYKQSQARNTQFIANGKQADSTLATSENQLYSAITVVQDIMVLANQAGNAALGDGERDKIATQIESRYQDLLSIANGTDGNGVYLFAGHQGSTRPFVEVSPGNVIYAGDQGQREVQIDPSRQIAISDNGADIFLRIKNGNGTFDTAGAATNAGSGTIDTGSVSDPAALTGHNYQISFTVAAGVTQYSVQDTTSGATVVPATPYQAGSGITVDGMSFTISGAPANGDQFTLAPSSNQSVFTTIHNLVTALRTPTAGNPAAQGMVETARRGALTELDQAADNIIRFQTAQGSRRKEIEDVAATNDTLNEGYESTISDLVDADYTKVISDFVQAQTALQAAQQTFKKVQDLNLFNYL